MKRLPLADQFEYRFIPPRPSRFWYRLGNYYSRYRIRREQKVMEIDVEGLDRLAARLDGGDSVLITPNHPDHADCFVLFELARRIGPALRLHGGLSDLHRPFPMGAAAGWRLLGRPRRGRPVGVQGGGQPAGRGARSAGHLPRGRDLPDRRAAHPAARGGLRDRGSGGQKAGGPDGRVWIMPVGLCYRFLEGDDPLPALRSLMDMLETRFTWRVQDHRPLVDRILHYADGNSQPQGSRVPGAPSARQLSRAIQSPDRADPHGNRGQAADRSQERDDSRAGQGSPPCMPRDPGKARMPQGVARSPAS